VEFCGYKARENKREKERKRLGRNLKKKTLRKTEERNP